MWEDFFWNSPPICISLRRKKYFTFLCVVNNNSGKEINIRYYSKTFRETGKAMSQKKIRRFWLVPCLHQSSYAIRITECWRRGKTETDNAPLDFSLNTVPRAHNDLIVFLWNLSLTLLLFLYIQYNGYLREPACYTIHGRPAKITAAPDEANKIKPAYSSTYFTGIKWWALQWSVLRYCFKYLCENCRQHIKCYNKGNVSPFYVLPECPALSLVSSLPFLCLHKDNNQREERNAQRRWF